MTEYVLSAWFREMFEYNPPPSINLKLTPKLVESLFQINPGIFRSRLSRFSLRIGKLPPGINHQPSLNKLISNKNQVDLLQGKSRDSSGL